MAEQKTEASLRAVARATKGINFRRGQIVEDTEPGPHRRPTDKEGKKTNDKDKIKNNTYEQKQREEKADNKSANEGKRTGDSE